VRQRQAELGQVEAPFVLHSEVAAIEAASGIPAAAFSDSVYSPSGVRTSELRTVSNHCYFYRSGKCAVYSMRPLDCRLFPFDIVENSAKELWWIVYLDLCPKLFSYEDYFGDAKQTFVEAAWNLDELRLLASHKSEVMAIHRHIFIERVIPVAACVTVTV